jgi:hypothetical protein
MSKSILVPMIAGYLEYYRGFDQPYHQQFVINESNRRKNPRHFRARELR